ncbi:MAG: hypothetical protein ACE5GT_04405 [Rhodospirillales bacterium]
MARTTIMGSTPYNRKDNRVEVPVISVSFDGDVYQTLDWGLGGFRVDDYKGSLLPGAEFIVDGIGPGDEEVFAIRIDCQAIRVADGQLAASFVELSGQAYDILEALMMRRKKFLEKLKMKS